MYHQISNHWFECHLEPSMMLWFLIKVSKIVWLWIILLIREKMLIGNVWNTYFSTVNVLTQKVEKLKSLCLQYAAATQWLISSSIDVPNIEEPSDGSLVSEKTKQYKSRSTSQSLKLSSSNTNVTESIL